MTDYKKAFVDTAPFIYFIEKIVIVCNEIVQIDNR